MSDSDEEVVNERRLKIVLLGDSQCGKTALCVRYVHDQYMGSYQPTVGVEFYAKRFKLGNKFHTTLQLWDIGGSQLDSPMIDKYIYGADGIVFIYDITNYGSFEHVKDWYRMVQRTLGAEEKQRVHFALVGNKLDLEHERAVKIEKHHELCKCYRMIGCQTSAKLGDSVALCFLKTTADVLGIQLSKSEMENNAPVIRAAVAKSEQTNDAASSDLIWSSKTKTCALQ